MASYGIAIKVNDLNNWSTIRPTYLHDINKSYPITLNASNWILTYEDGCYYELYPTESYEWNGPGGNYYGSCWCDNGPGVSVPSYENSVSGFYDVYIYDTMNTITYDGIPYFVFEPYWQTWKEEGTGGYDRQIVNKSLSSFTSDADDYFSGFASNRGTMFVDMKVSYNKSNGGSAPTGTLAVLLSNDNTTLPFYEGMYCFDSKSMGAYSVTHTGGLSKGVFAVHNVTNTTRNLYIKYTNSGLSNNNRPSWAYYTRSNDSGFNAWITKTDSNDYNKTYYAITTNSSGGNSIIAADSITVAAGYKYTFYIHMRCGATNDGIVISSGTTVPTYKSSISSYTASNILYKRSGNGTTSITGTYTYTASSSGTLRLCFSQNTSTWGFSYGTNIADVEVVKESAPTITVTLNKNSGTGGSDSVQIIPGCPAANYPSITLPTRTGFTFLGYYDDQVTGTQYITATGAGARTFDKTSACTLYAHWKAIITESYHDGQVWTAPGATSLSAATTVEIATSAPSTGATAVTLEVTATTIPSGWSLSSDKKSVSIPSGTATGQYTVTIHMVSPASAPSINEATTLDKTVTVTVVAPSVQSYDNPVINTYSYATYAAAGATKNPTVTYSQTAHWSSGVTTSITTGGTLAFTAGTLTSGASKATATDYVFATKGGIIWANNTTTSSRSTHSALSVTVTMNGKTSTAKTCTACTQSAGSKVYGTPTVSAYTYITSVAAGGTTNLSPATLTYSQTWTWNGVSGSGGTISTGGTLAFTRATTYSWMTAGTDFATTGKINVSSRGTTIGNARNFYGALSVTVTLNEKTSASKTCTAGTQVGNYVVSIVPKRADQTDGAHFYYDNISAGATSATPTMAGAAQYTFSSGSTVIETTTSPTFGGTTTFSRTYSYSGSTNGFTAVNSSTGVLTATARGTTIGNARTSGTVTSVLTVTYTHASSYSGGGTVTSSGKSSTATCTQNGNYVTSITPKASSGTSHFSYANIGAGATSASPTLSGAATYHFSSGSTSTSNPGSTYGTATYSRTYTLATPVQNGFTAVNSSTGVLTATNRGKTTGAARTSSTVTSVLTVTWVHSSTYSAGGTVTSSTMTSTGTCTQAANYLTIGDPTLTVSSPATPYSMNKAGETKAITASATQTGTYTSGSTDTYTPTITYTVKTVKDGFSLSSNNVTVSNNTSTTARNGFVVTVTATGTTGTNSTYITGYNKTATSDRVFNQPAGAKVYGTPTVSAYSYATYAAAGATKTPTVSYSQTWTWNGVSGSGGTITTGGTLAFTKGTLTSGATAGSSFATDGSITWANNTTTSSRSTHSVLSVTVALNSKTSTAKTCTACTQSAGAKVYSTPTVSVYSYETYAAAGATKTPTVTYSMPYTWNSVSGSGGSDTTGGTLTFTKGTLTSGATAASNFATTGSITWANNTTTSARSTHSVLSVTVKTPTGNLTSTAKTCTACTQSAGAKVYGTPTVSAYSYTNTAASGATNKTPTVSYSQTWTWNSVSGSGGTITSGGTLAFTKSGTVPTGFSTGTNFATTGAVTWASRGMTIGNALDAKSNLTVTVTLNNKTSAAFTCTGCIINGNYVVSIVPKRADQTDGAHFYYNNITAGATSATPTMAGAAQYTFSSGSTIIDTTSSPSFGGTTTYTRTFSLATPVQNGFTAVNSSTGVLTATSYGTTPGAARTSSTVTSVLTVKYTHASAYSAGGTITSSQKTSTGTCTQEANTRTYGTVTLTVSAPATPYSMNKAGETKAITASATQPVSYTSGASETFTPTITYAVKTAKDGFSLSSNSVTVTNNTSTTARNGFEVTVTATGATGTNSTYDTGYNKTATSDRVFNQPAGAKVYAAPVTTLKYATGLSAAGVTDRLPSTLTCTQTWTWNGVSGSGETNVDVKGISTFTFTNTGAYSWCTNGTDFSSTGAINLASRGSTTGAARNFYSAIKVSATANGVSSTAKAATAGNQAINVLTWGNVSLTVSSPATPYSMNKAGETKAITASATQTGSYSSGVTTTLEEQGHSQPTVSFAVTTAKDGYSLNDNEVTVTNNTSTSARNGFEVTVTGTGVTGTNTTLIKGYNKTATSKRTFNQPAGAKVYETPTLSGSYTYATAAAAGVTDTPPSATPSYSQVWTWNGVSSSGGTITTGGTYGYSTTGTLPSGFSTGTNFATTGNIKWANNTTTSAKDAKSNLKVTVSLNGKTSAAMTCTACSQSAGVKVYETPTVLTYAYTNTAASGATNKTPTAPTYTQTWTWNGVSGSGGSITSGGTLAYTTTGTLPTGFSKGTDFATTGAITWANRTTTTGSARDAKSNLRVTVALNDKTSAVFTCTSCLQEANELLTQKYKNTSGTTGYNIEYVKPSVSIGSGITAGGGSAKVTCSVTNNTNWYQKYSSGSYTSLQTGTEAGTAKWRITSNGNSRFGYSGTSSSLSGVGTVYNTGGKVTHSNMRNDLVTDTVIVTAYNIGDTSKIKTAIKSVTNSVISLEINPSSATIPYLGKTSIETNATYSSGYEEYVEPTYTASPSDIVSFENKIDVNYVLHIDKFNNLGKAENEGYGSCKAWAEDFADMHVNCDSYHYYGDLYYNGNQYHIWRTEYNTTNRNNPQYIVTQTDDYSTLYEQSIEFNSNNINVHPIVVLLGEDLEDWYTGIDKNIVWIEN